MFSIFTQIGTVHYHYNHQILILQCYNLRGLTCLWSELTGIAEFKLLSFEHWRNRVTTSNIPEGWLCHCLRVLAEQFGPFYRRLCLLLAVKKTELLLSRGQERQCVRPPQIRLHRSSHRVFRHFCFLQFWLSQSSRKMRSGRVVLLVPTAYGKQFSMYNKDNTEILKRFLRTIFTFSCLCTQKKIKTNTDYLHPYT